MSAAPPSPATTLVRPWSEFFSLSSLSLPVSLSDATSRLTLNLSHFQANYAAVSLFILLCSLVYHPISLLLLLVALLAWFFLYFSRSVPLVVLNFEIDDRIVVGVLGVVTVVVLVIARVWVNVIVSILVAGVVVGLHAVSRVPNLGDDPYGGLLSSVVDESGGGAYSEF